MAQNKKLEDNLKENERMFGKWAKTYDATLFQFWMRRFQVPIFREIELKAGTKILDISCGTGKLLQTLDEKSNGKVQLYGLDLSQKMLDSARQKLPAAVTLVRGDVHHLPFEENQFDYVLCTEAFHHYHSQEKAIAEMKRVVKKNGKVMIVDINFFSRIIHWLFEKIEPGCVKVNNEKEMSTLFEKNGLPVIKQRRNFIFAMMTIGRKKDEEK